MAFEVPGADELKRIAHANHIELTSAELAALQGMMPGQMAIIEQIDALPTTPDVSATRYRDRVAGTRPSPKDDPLNAIVTRCSVKGAASGLLKGKRVGVKDSVCVAGIPASGGSSVLKGYVGERDDAALGEYDALVMPSTPMKAHRLGERAHYSMITNTAPFDMSGHPAVSVPCGKSNGLPVGLMIVGRHFEDATVLKIAYAYEQSVDWRRA